MTVTAPRPLGMLAFALAVCPALALAEAGPAGRTWTDPPAREAVGAREETPRPPEAVPVKPPRPAHAAVRGGKAHAGKVDGAKVSASKVNASKVRAAEAVSARPTPRVEVATRPVLHRRFVGVAPRARGADRDFVSRRDSGFRNAFAVQQAPAFRVVTVRPSFHTPPPPFYGYVVQEAPFREAARAAQIREAEAAGYRVVRSRVSAFPDGGRPRAYRFLDEDADD